NELVVNGSLTHTSGVDFKNNLTVRGKNFIAVDNAALLNSNVYGRGIISVDADVNGTISAPDIAGNIALQKGSKITFVRQQIAASAKDQIGVIQFVDMDTVKPWTLPIGNIDPPKKSFYASALHYNLNIDVDKEAEFILVIDPITRDELSITGSAQLNAMLNPNGSISLIGAYNLSKGSYQLNYSFLKRKFALQEGSTILFSGDPEMAEANITAVYEIEASPFDLIGTEISGNSSNDLFRQKMPFEVVLKVKGQVLEPQLSFDIKLKDKVAGINSQMLTTIDNKLTQLRSDASGMNKEVFALLVMGRFIGEQSSDFFAGSNSGVKADQVVKESVSRFLSDAVSQIASDLIKGVDIDVNLRTIDEYSSSTQRTDLGLALSKRFLDDRLTISVGKNFTVEGNDPIAKGQNNANISFLPDVSTAYKLSKDGRYILRAYRRNQYEAILDGYFIETGLAFSLSMEYNKFNELLKKSK
ncbi:MAG: translocation/assembly module TamB domain-containing protein, partial [Sediminibacterium sp.]